MRHNVIKDIFDRSFDVARKTLIEEKGCNSFSGVELTNNEGDITLVDDMMLHFHFAKGTPDEFTLTACSNKEKNTYALSRYKMEDDSFIELFSFKQVSAPNNDVKIDNSHPLSKVCLKLFESEVVKAEMCLKAKKYKKDKIKKFKKKNKIRLVR